MYSGLNVDIIYYYVIWTDNGSMLLLLHSVDSVPILYRTGNMQSAILLSFVTSSSNQQVGFNLPIDCTYITT